MVCKFISIKLLLEKKLFLKNATHPEIIPMVLRGHKVAVKMKGQWIHRTILFTMQPHPPEPPIWA